MRYSLPALLLWTHFMHKTPNSIVLLLYKIIIYYFLLFIFFEG
jgi:hypothetical protein